MERFEMVVNPFDSLVPLETQETSTRKRQMSMLHVLLILVVLVTFTTCLERIVGGNQVEIMRVPYQISVLQDLQSICGGALIGLRYALSAAHCFHTPGMYRIRAGSSLKDSGGEIVNIRKVLLHPKRTTRLYEYDIAILELERPVKFKSTIQPVQLPDNDALIVPGINGMISGFGDTYTAENTGSRVLRVAQVSVQNLKSCEKSYSLYGIPITSSVFCAGSPQGTKDSCQGDSGGPFVIDNVLYGLVSFGLQCGDPEHPGVYTNVAVFRDFIRINTGI
ncbi:hypothetical protein HUJ04_001578 [Dendroctonus ponderosae]|nr:hypothetical protein HUJ04_001578 [Dendroctonus ponderosae]